MATRPHNNFLLVYFKKWQKFIIPREKGILFRFAFYSSACNGDFSDLILLNNVKSTKGIDFIAMSKLGIYSGLQNNGSGFFN